MPLLIDTPRWPAHGRLWSHLISDTSFAELHAFADLVGLPPRSFEGDHYDVPSERHQAVVAAGARPVSMRELVTTLQASGLRRPKRKGERVLASTLLQQGDDGVPSARRDLLASPLPPPVTPARIDVLVLSSATGRSLLVVPDRAAPTGWSLPGGPHDTDLPIEAAGARMVHQQAGVRLRLSSVSFCGHERTLPADGHLAGWATYLTAQVTSPTTSECDGEWLPLLDAHDALGRPAWWPLLDWLLDRHQPRTTF